MKFSSGVMVRVPSPLSVINALSMKYHQRPDGTIRITRITIFIAASNSECRCRFHSQASSAVGENQMRFCVPTSWLGTITPFTISNTCQ
ncbi:hypothetical protein OK016_22140 [Vibrio chagasii]|nr:hypothetical protein [Vibrio chagasii]